MLLRKAVLAAIVGGACGAVAGLWPPASGTDHGPSVAAAPTAPIAEQAGPARTPAAEPARALAQPAEPPQARVVVSPATVAESGDAVQRARVLAQRPDVNGLVALREEVLRRAEDAGGKASPEAKGQLDEIDRYLTEARVLRLKLDAAEFRREVADGTPPR